MEKTNSPTKTVTADTRSLLQEAKPHRMQKILENDEKTRVNHHSKLEKSSTIFSNTKVTSCSGVLMSGGLSVAMPFKGRGSTQHVEIVKNPKLISHTQ